MRSSIRYWRCFCNQVFTFHSTTTQEKMYGVMQMHCWKCKRGGLNWLLMGRFL